MDYNVEHVMTLANSIIGVSVLAMPYCFKQCGIILSIVMLLVSSILSRLACHFLLKSAIMARRKTFEFLAFHVFGTPGKFIIEIGMIGFLLGTCIAFFVVMGDLGPEIVVEITGTHTTSMMRSSILMALALFCVLPLGLLRNVDSLAGVSKATIGFYCCLVLKIVLESAQHFFLGNWLSKVELWRPAGILQCIPIFSMALFCQTQLFEIYQAMPNATLQVMNNTIKIAVNICTCVYIFVGMFGYIAFYQRPFSGNILMSFTPSLISDVMKVGFVLSVAFSFPLVIFPCRASLHSLIYKRAYASLEGPTSNYIPEGRFKLLTFLIVLVSLIVGILIPNIELVLGLVGSTIGVMICVLFPVTCFICLSHKNTNERILAQIILFIGVLVMVLGTYANLYAIEEIHTSPAPEIPRDIKMDIEDVQQDPVVNLVNAEENLALPNLNPNPVVIDQKADSVVNKELKETKLEPSLFKEVRHEPPQPMEPVDVPASQESKVDIPDKKENVNVEKRVDLSKETQLKKDEVKNNLEENAVEDYKPREPDKQVEESKNVVEEDAKSKKDLEKADEVDMQAIQKEDQELKEQAKEAPNKDLIETLERQNQVQQELVEQQKKLIEVIKQQQVLVNEKQQNEIDKVQKEKLDAVKEIQNIAQKAIESLGVKENENIQEIKLPVPDEVDKNKENNKDEVPKVDGNEIENLPKKVVPAAKPFSVDLESNNEIPKVDNVEKKEQSARSDKLVPLPLVLSNNLTIFGEPREEKGPPPDVKVIEKPVLKNEININKIETMNVNIKNEINMIDNKKINSTNKKAETQSKKLINNTDTNQIKIKSENTDTAAKRDILSNKESVREKRDVETVNKMCDDGQECPVKNSVENSFVDVVHKKLSESNLGKLNLNNLEIESIDVNLKPIRIGIKTK